MAFGKIEILPNTAYEDFRQVGFYNSSGFVQTDDSAINISGGPRWMDSTPPTSNARIGYRNPIRTPPGEFDRIIITNAGYLSGLDVEFIFYDTFDTVKVGETISSFSETLIGKNSSDYVYYPTTNVSGVTEDGESAPAEAGVMIEITGAAQTMYKMFASRSIRLPQIVGNSVTRRPMKRGTRIKTGRLFYEVAEQLSFSAFGMDKDTIDRIHDSWSMYENGFFLYDNAGAYIKEKLMHCVLVGVPQSYEYDDSYALTMTVARLRDNDIE